MKPMTTMILENPIVPENQIQAAGNVIAANV